MAIYNLQYINEFFNGQNKKNTPNLEEFKNRKEEFDKVIYIAKTAIKNAKSKFGKDLDFLIKVDINSDQAQEFYDQKDDTVILIRGGLYPPNKPVKYIDDTDLENKRISILDSIIKEIEKEINKDKSIRGKLIDDWSYISFQYLYKL